MVSLLRNWYRSLPLANLLLLPPFRLERRATRWIDSLQDRLHPLLPSTLRYPIIELLQRCHYYLLEAPFSSATKSWPSPTNLIKTADKEITEWGEDYLCQLTGPIIVVVDDEKWWLRRELHSNSWKTDHALDLRRSDFVGSVSLILVLWSILHPPGQWKHFFLNRKSLSIINNWLSTFYVDSSPSCYFPCCT